MDQVEASFAENLDPGRYHPRFNATETNPVKEWTFSPNQKTKRSVYFEGIPEVYMDGAQPNVELNKIRFG